MERGREREKGGREREKGERERKGGERERGGGREDSNIVEKEHCRNHLPSAIGIEIKTSAINKPLAIRKHTRK
jgi:hypothetical protein